MDPGSVIAERFEVDREVGSGGMGRVYRARDRLTGATVALKIVRPGSTPGGGTMERFVREASALAEIAHPAVVRYIAHGELPSGERYLAMDWVEGETLSQRLGRGERMPIGEAMTLVRRIASALGAAHAKQIVHRDVKPSNIVLAGGSVSNAMLIDFGLARLGGASELTRTGIAVGTPQYLSPEQARGSRRVDARADVYALGVLLFRCITGRHPFRGDDLMALFAKVLLEIPPRLSDFVTVPAALDDLCARMLSKSHEDRPRHGAAAADEIAAIPAPNERALPVVVPAPKLTAAEQRILSVIMVPPLPGGAPIDEDAETIIQPTRVAQLHDLEAVARAFGGALDTLASGAMVVSLAGAGGAVERAGRAARCALRMRAALPGESIVLATGRGVVSDRTLVGDVIEGAARLLGAGAIDGVRIDELTASLLDVGSASSAGASSSSGFEIGGDETGLFIVGERAATPARKLLGVATPCVGRERDLQNLFAAWAQCCEDETAHAVVVIGDAGLGKSRLRYELLRRIEESGAPGEVWLARADALRMDSPFGMLGDALRAAAGTREGEPANVQRQKLRARVARHVPAADVARVSEFLGEMAGISFSDEASVQLRAARREPVLMGDQLRRAFEDFVAAECAHGPVLLVLEDLHWGDLPTVAAIDHALRNLARSPFMVLAFARPSVTDAFPKLWAGRPCDVLRLSELSRKASERLVRAVLPDAPDGVLERVLDLAQGNAFYLEELVRAVAEGRGSSLPDSVLAIVQTRLDALDPEARRILRAASVFGHAFWESAIASLLPADESSAALQAWLEFLADREIVSRRTTSRFGGERELTFRHAIVRETAYAMLTEEDRALGHALAAEWLESRGERDAAVLAEHHERSGDRSRAALHFERAARQALDANNMAGVLAMVDRALACGVDEELRGRLDLLRAEVLWWRGALQDAEQAAHAAMSRLPEGSPRYYEAMGHLVGSWGKRGDRAPILDVGRPLLARALRGGADDTQIDVLARVLIALSYDLETRDVVAPYVAFLEGVLAAGTCAEPAVLGRVHQGLGMHAGNLNRWGRCVEMFQAAVRDFEQVGNRRNAVLMDSNFGVALCFLGQHGRAREVFTRSLAITESLGTEYLHASLLSDIGQTLLLEGHPDEAEAMLREAGAFFEGAEGPIARNNRLSLAHCLVAQGRADEATSIAEPMVSSPDVEDASRWKALVLLAEVALSRDDAPEALRRMTEARAVFERAGGRHLEEAYLVRVHVDALLAAGKSNEARAEARRGKALILGHAASVDDTLRASFLATRDNARVLEVAE